MSFCNVSCSCENQIDLPLGGIGTGTVSLKQHIRITLQSIMKYNFVSDFSRHFNNMRSYVMGDEAGLLMASWPKGRLEVPFPLFCRSNDRV